MIEKIKNILIIIWRPINALWKILDDIIKQETIKEAREEAKQEESFRLHNSFDFSEEMRKEDFYFWETPNQDKDFDAKVNKIFEEHQKYVKENPELFPSAEVAAVMKELSKDYTNFWKFVKFLFTWKDYQKVPYATKKELFLKAKVIVVQKKFELLKDSDSVNDTVWYICTGLLPTPYMTDVSTYSLYKRAKFFKSVQRTFIYKRFLIEKIRKFLRLFFKDKEFFQNWDKLPFREIILPRYSAIKKNEIFCEEIDHTFVFGSDLSDQQFDNLNSLIITMLYGGYSMSLLNQKLSFIFGGDIKNFFLTKAEIRAVEERYELIKQEVSSSKMSQIIEDIPSSVEIIFFFKFWKDMWFKFYPDFKEFVYFFSIKSFSKEKKKNFK